MSGEENSGAKRSRPQGVQRSRKRRETVCKQRAANVKEPNQEKHERKTLRGRKFAPVRGHEQSDPGGHKNSAERHREENWPSKSGATFVPGFEIEDARSNLCIDDPSLSPPLNLGFELAALIHVRNYSSATFNSHISLSC